MNGSLPDSDIISLLAPSMDMAKAYQRELSEERERHYRIYRAMPYGNEVDGWSKVVHPTAFSAVEWAKPGLFEVLTGDFFDLLPIRKEPTQNPTVPWMGMPPDGMQGGPGPAGAPPSAALQPTPPMPPRMGPKPADPLQESAKRIKRYIRHKLFEQLDGEQIIDDGIHNALTQHYAIAKVTQRDDYDLDTEIVDRISSQDAQMLAQAPDFVSLNGGQYVQEYDSTTGYYWEGIEGATLVRKIVHYTGFNVEIVPATELYFLPGYPDLQKNPFVAHVVRRDLDYVRRQEMAGVYRQGSTDAVKDKLAQRNDPVETDQEQATKWESEGLSRPSDYGDATSTRPERLPANEVLVWECYLRLDIRGDGLLRPCIVTVCEDVVLRDPVDNPYGGPPFELGYIYKEPHKVEGRPIPAMLEQQQKVMTNLLRATQDSAARSTYAGWLTSDAKSYAVLRDFIPGGVGYVPDLQKIQELKTSPPQQFIFNALQYTEQQISKESGVNENQMGLDNNSLNKTASGMNMRLTSGMQRQKLYAHRMARWWKRILRRIIDVMRLFPPHDDVALVGADIMIRPEDLDGQYTVAIEVGVGPQDRQAQAAMMNQYIQMASQMLIPAGLAQPAHLLPAIDAMFEYQDMDVTAYHFDEEEADAWGKMQAQMQQMGQALQQAQGEAAGLKKALDEHVQSMGQGQQQGQEQMMPPPMAQGQMPQGGAYGSA